VYKNNIRCKDCEHHQVIRYGLKTATTQYEGHLCGIEPEVGVFDPIYGEKKGYTSLRKNHLNTNSPKWCPKKLQSNKGN